MTRNVLITIILVLAFIGIADSWYLAESAFTGAALTCNIGAGLDGCNTVAQSPYSHLFGIPLAAYGFVFYCLTFVLSAVMLAAPALSLRRALYILSVIGAIASVIFIAIQGFLIHALCVYCLVSALISFVICYLARRIYKALASAAFPQPVVQPW